MVYETFLKTIQSMVQTRLNKKANVSLRRVLKNNGLMLDGLSFTKPGSRLSPTVYLNAYYNEAEEGMPLSIITEQILMVYETNPGFSSASMPSSSREISHRARWSLCTRVVICPSSLSVRIR